MAGTQFLCSLSRVHSPYLPELVLDFSSSQRPTGMNRICLWRAEKTRWPQHHRGPQYSISFSNHCSDLDFLCTWISFFQLTILSTFLLSRIPESLAHVRRYFDVFSRSSPFVRAEPVDCCFFGWPPMTQQTRGKPLLSDQAVTGADRDQGSSSPQVTLHVPCLPLQSFSLWGCIWWLAKVTALQPISDSSKGKPKYSQLQKWIN